MNRLLSITLAFVSSLALANVDSEKIKYVAQELANYTSSSNEYKVKPASAMEMMKELSFGELQMDDFYYDEESSIDVDSSAWGIISFKIAISWIQYSQFLSQDENGNEVKNSPESIKAAALIESLDGTGAIFGAGPFGAVQCGITFPAFLIMDTKKGIIYSFETEGSGC